MTLPRSSVAPPAERPGRRPGPPPRMTAARSVPTAGYALLAAVLTVVVRLIRVDRASDLFVDELIYQDLGRSAAQGGFPHTSGGLFFLHPPGFFYLEAGWMRLFGEHQDVIAQVHSLRVLNALLAGVSAALLVLLVARVRSRPAGLVAGLLFALDQFCIRQNNWVLLETATMTWVLAGFLVLLPLCRAEPPRRPRARATAGGLLLGLAVLTKDHSVLITVLPLLLALALNWGPPRRLTGLALAVALVPYTVYVSLVVRFGHWAPFWEQKTQGLDRLLGLTQETGFNAPGTPSLAGRLAGELPAFTVTYLLLALTPVALFLLLRRRDPVYRLLALFHACAIVTLAYALGIGTLEEQALYLLFVPNLVALAVTVPMPRRRPALRAVAVAGLVALLATPAVVYAADRGTPDDGLVRMQAYLRQHVPPGSGVVSVDGLRTDGVTFWTFGDTYRIGPWITPGEQAAHRARYVIVPWKVIDEGYGRFTPAEVRGLTRDARLLYAFRGPTYGTLALYELPPAPAAAGPR
ncbi:phospholipid carrier-dependent glycosyltransferase [Streptomyces sp. NBC_01216]|uniref:ArnT family glycosyltransferase n=1 Tax=unclassified Streptomyces TaxID=2593676 RepID=UPI002E0FA01E|nr:glycosyltransferase family 39 protein [Streptomyces sp. NBC_01216]